MVYVSHQIPENWLMQFKKKWQRCCIEETHLSYKYLKSAKPDIKMNEIKALLTYIEQHNKVITCHFRKQGYSETCNIPRNIAMLLTSKPLNIDMSRLSLELLYTITA